MDSRPTLQRLRAVCAATDASLFYLTCPDYCDKYFSRAADMSFIVSKIYDCCLWLC